MRGTQRLRVEADDLRRAQSLRANAKRQRLRRAAPDLETFIRSLDITLVIERQNRAAIPRVSQLTQRTNQFNLTTKRYSPGDIEHLMDNGFVYCMRMEDRFSDYGIVGVAIVTDAGTDSWEIDSFMLSCRAFGRRIESELLATVLADAGGLGIKVVWARYVATAKNGMSRDFFPGHGFSLTERSRRRTPVQSHARRSHHRGRPGTVSSLAKRGYVMTEDTHGRWSGSSGVCSG